jgi:hypothetical protein
MDRKQRDYKARALGRQPFVMRCLAQLGPSDARITAAILLKG